MTHYILAGGNDQESSSFGPDVARKCRELLSKSHLNILANYFATEPERRTEKHKSFEPWYRESFGDMTLEVANEAEFLEQIKKADVIFFHGGLTSRLVENMKAFPAIERHFDNKVVIGSSAGAGWLSRLCWSMNAREIVEGSGIVGVAAIAHYGSVGNEQVHYTAEDWERVVDTVEPRAKQADIKLVRIPEGEFIVLEK